jgi:hypothetical protein
MVNSRNRGVARGSGALSGGTISGDDFCDFLYDIQISYTQLCDFIGGCPDAMPPRPAWEEFFEMTYSFSDPKLERELTWIAKTCGDSKIAVLRQLIEEKKKRMRRKFEDE